MDPAQRAQTIQDRYNANLESIRSNRDLTPDGKRSRIAAEYERTSAELRVIRESSDQAIAARRFDLQKRLFGIDGNSDPNAAISFRDAQDRAANLGPRDQEKALDLLHRAQLSGDSTLAKALAQRAGETGWHGVLQAYADSNPGAGDAISELASLTPSNTSRGLTQRLHEQFTFNAAKPAELR